MPPWKVFSGKTATTPKKSQQLPPDELAARRAQHEAMVARMMKARNAG